MGYLEHLGQGSAATTGASFGLDRAHRKVVGKNRQDIVTNVSHARDLVDANAHLMEHGWQRLSEADQLRGLLAGDNPVLHQLMMQDEVGFALECRRIRNRALGGF